MKVWRDGRGMLTAPEPVERILYTGGRKKKDSAFQMKGGTENRLG